MFFTPKIFFIFYTIPLLKAVSLKIDGLIHLGPNWSYEYRILTPNESSKQQIARSRHEEHHHIDPQEDDRMRKDEERLRKAEDRLRKEAAELRQAAQEQTYDTHHKDIAHDNDQAKHHVEQQRNRHAELPRKPEKRDTEHANQPKIEKEKHSEEIKWTTQKLVTFSSNSDESSSVFDSGDETTAKPGTMSDLYDFMTTSKSRNRSQTETKKRKEKSEYENEKLANIPIKSEHFNETIMDHVSKGFNHFNVSIENKTTPTPVTNATKPTTIQVTTVRTGDIYSNPHIVKDDPKVIEFTNHIYKQTLKVFDDVKRKTSEYHIKKQLDALAKSYEDKFKEFLRDTSTQKVKTRLGTQKVILNTIDVSNRIVKRLINFMIGDMDKKGLRHNIATANIFKQEIDKEKNLELRHACNKFGISAPGAGFSEFLTEVINLVLRCDDRMFKQSIDALTEAAKNANYDKALDSHTELKLKDGVEKVERLSIFVLRLKLMVLKNIIVNRNKPLIVNNLSVKRRINATLAFLEIIDLLDQKMSGNVSNALEWAHITNSLRDYSEGERYDVQEIMEVFIKHLKKTLRGLDEASQKIVCKNINTILD